MQNSAKADIYNPETDKKTLKHNSFSQVIKCPLIRLHQVYNQRLGLW
jgi:hypothetical protein